MRYKYQNVVRDGNGVVVRSATVSVYLAGTTTAATVYTSATSTTGVNSVTSDATDGSFTFYVDAFDYGSYQQFKTTASKTGFGSSTVDNISITDVVSGTYSITSAKTFSAPVFIPKNVIYSQGTGGSIAVSAGIAFDAGNYQIFSGFGAGEVVFNSGSVDYINPKWFGTLNTAITVISTNSAHVRLNYAETLTASLTIPATCALTIVKSGSIIKASTYTCTINGPFEAGNYQVFSGFTAGDVTGLSEVKPEWWGSDNTAFGCALSLVKTGGAKLILQPTKTYTLTSVQTLSRSAAGNATRWIIEGNGATLDFTAVTTGSLLTVGADSTTYFAETGEIKISDLNILGPESGTPHSAATADTDTVGLLLQYASRVTLNNVHIRKCYTGIKSGYVFPLNATNVSVRENFIGLHLDASSNIHQWNNLNANECRQSVLIFKSGNFGGGKIVDVAFNGLWMETSQNGVHVDTGAGGGTPFILRLSFKNFYTSGITYDTFRLGIAFDFDTPETRGADRASQLYGVYFENGKWQAAAYGATNAAIVFPTSASAIVREVHGTVNFSSSDASAIINAPSSSEIVFLDNAANSYAQAYAPKRWNNVGTQIAAINDYVSTTWTPVLTFATPGDLNVVYSKRVATYVKIGNFVTLNFRIETSTFTHTTASDVLRVTGLPLTPRTVTDQRYYGTLSWGGITKATYTSIIPMVESASTVMTFLASGSGVGVSSVAVADVPTGGNVYIDGSITYEVVV